MGTRFNRLLHMYTYDTNSCMTMSDPTQTCRCGRPAQKHPIVELDGARYASIVSDMSRDPRVCEDTPAG